MACPYCGSNKIGRDRDYARHIGPKDEWKTIGSEMYCLDCGKYVFPANKWLINKNAKSIDN